MVEFVAMKALPSYVLGFALLATPAVWADGVGELTPKAEAGDLVSQVELARIYEKGSGVSKDVKEAAKWYAKAAEQGNLDAQVALGAIYFRGQGVPRDSREAAKWFLMAATQGNAGAQCQMARQHMMGAGVPKDDIEAYKYAWLAAGQGDAAAKKVVMILEMRMTPEEILQAKEHDKTVEELKKLDEVAPEQAPPLEPIKPEALEPAAN